MQDRTIEAKNHGQKIKVHTTTLISVDKWSVENYDYQIRLLNFDGLKDLIKSHGWIRNPRIEEGDVIIGDHDDIFGKISYVRIKIDDWINFTTWNLLHTP